MLDLSVSRSLEKGTRQVFLRKAAAPTSNMVPDHNYISCTLYSAIGITDAQLTSKTVEINSNYSHSGWILKASFQTGI